MQEALSALRGVFAVSMRTLFDIGFSVALAVAVALIIAQMYKYTHRGLNYELSFMKTLVLLAPIVTSVMLFIRGDLVLSLGLIGSLSIIRFRTPIKDTRDMVFLFWTISVGLGCGTYNWVVVLVTTLVMVLLIFVLHLLRYGVVKSRDFVLVVSGAGEIQGSATHAVLSAHAQDIAVRSQEVDGDRWEIIYELYIKTMTPQATEQLTRALRSVQGVDKVSLLAPQIVLPT